jgi:G3E family GTPase
MECSPTLRLSHDAAGYDKHMSSVFPKQIPVTVIGGFLGAGKTTLLNHLVASHQDVTFGIIINEFGSTGIDGSLIENVDSDGVAELSNGCLCCFGRDDLVAALVKLANHATPPDYVLVELSGVADPVPVAQTILDPLVKTLFRLDGIIGLADARNLWETVQQSPEGAVQLSYANTIVLNKLDLATAEQLEAAKQLLNKLNPLATVQETSHAQASGVSLLNIRAFDPEAQLSSHETRHTPGLKNFTLRAERPLSRAGFNRFVERMIVARPDQVLRAKGYLFLEDLDKPVLFQSVREIFNLKLAETPSKPDQHSQLVIIGKNLDKAEFERTFESALSSARPFAGLKRLQKSR